ncbi:MAG: FAD-binding oxidoreductase, partial [Chloroflexi bacterium]|nr:FAD-binding oxidoreductase [Chloroflexota bacterium]
MSLTADAIIIGGGVHGASLAFHLARRKLRVLLLEKKFLASGGTGKSTALVRQHYDNFVESALTHASWKYFVNWNEVVGGDAGFVQSGFIRTVIASELDALRANTAMHARIGITTKLITAREVKEIEPSWDVSDIEYAAYEPDSGYADPQATTLTLADAAKKLGAQIFQ